MNALWNSQGFVVWCRVVWQKWDCFIFPCWFWWWGLSTATGGLKVIVVNTIRRRLIKVRLLYSTRRTQPYESMSNVTVSSSKWEAYDFLYLAMQWPMSFCNMAGVTCRWQVTPNYFTVHGLWPQNNRLDSTDAAGRVPHPSPTWPDAGRSVWRGWPSVGVASEFFFFFFFFDSRWTGLIRPESGRIGQQPKWPKRTETVKTGRNWPWIWPEQLKFSSQSVFCLFLSLFCESRIVMCFLIIF